MHLKPAGGEMGQPGEAVELGCPCFGGRGDREDAAGSGRYLSARECKAVAVETAGKIGIAGEERGDRLRETGHPELGHQVPAEPAKARGIVDAAIDRPQEALRKDGMGIIDAQHGSDARQGFLERERDPPLDRHRVNDSIMDRAKAHLRTSRAAKKPSSPDAGPMAFAG